MYFLQLCACRLTNLSCITSEKSLLSSVTSIDVVMREPYSAIEFEKTVNDDVC